LQIIRNLKKIPNLSLALGFFDGIHIGHQAVIEGAVDFAKKHDTKSAVVTFKEHPFCFLKMVTPKYILPRQDKYKILEDLGVNYIIELDFDHIYDMSARNYLENILVHYFSPKAISTGFNHHFGANREGDVSFLSNNQNELGYMYFATPAKKLYGEPISSSKIRRFISDGAVDIATKMLGRDFYVSGKVVHGQKLGGTIGFPTANILYPNDIIQPAFGVYKTSVELKNGKIYKGLANFGLRPTVGNNDEPRLEVHILNFKGDLYGQDIKINFEKMIRPEKKFRSITSLKEQIKKDLESL